MEDGDVRLEKNRNRSALPPRRRRRRRLCPWGPWRASVRQWKARRAGLFGTHCSYLFGGFTRTAAASRAASLRRDARGREDKKRGGVALAGTRRKGKEHAAGGGWRRGAEAAAGGLRGEAARPAAVTVSRAVAVARRDVQDTRGTLCTVPAR